MTDNPFIHGEIFGIPVRAQLKPYATHSERLRFQALLDRRKVPEDQAKIESLEGKIRSLEAKIAELENW